MADEHRACDDMMEHQEAGQESGGRTNVSSTSLPFSGDAPLSVQTSSEADPGTQPLLENSALSARPSAFEAVNRKIQELPIRPPTDDLDLNSSKQHEEFMYQTILQYAQYVDQGPRDGITASGSVARSNKLLRILGFHRQSAESMVEHLNLMARPESFPDCVQAKKKDMAQSQLEVIEHTIATVEASRQWDLAHFDEEIAELEAKYREGNAELEAKQRDLESQRDSILHHKAVRSQLTATDSHGVEGGNGA